MPTITEFDVLDERPADIDSSWLIFNAPRPIYGTRIWQGKFVEGIFYAAIDPADREAAQFIQVNACLKAVLLRYITMQTIRDWAQELANRKGYILEDCTDGELKMMYFGSGHGKRGIEI